MSKKKKKKQRVYEKNKDSSFELERRKRNGKNTVFDNASAVSI